MKYHRIGAAVRNFSKPVEAMLSIQATGVRFHFSVSHWVLSFILPHLVAKLQSVYCAVEEHILVLEDPYSFQIGF